MNEAVTLSFAAALLLGLGFGAGPCNIACLPYLAPVFLTGESGVGTSWRVILPFSLGRVSGYSLLGLLAGWLGGDLTNRLESAPTRWILGIATLMVALSLLVRRSHNPACSESNGVRVGLPTPAVPRYGNHSLLPSGLFFMGAGLALNPCLPLGTVLLAAAASGSGGAGLSLGIGFGIGAALIPALIFGVGMAHFGAEIRRYLAQWRSRLELAGIAMLIIMGIGTTAGWITT
jgi:cytochrome c biogenesis protein CcdA